jgi:hypothetical protein
MKAKNWLTNKELNKFKRPQQELPDKVIGCLITLILFHCGLSDNQDIFAVLPNDI